MDAGDDAQVDAGSDVDNGSPSTNYPAPHPPLPQLVNASKGPVLTAPKIYLVFYPSYPLEAAIVGFAQSVAASKFWGQATAEYGVGALTYGGTIDLTDTPPANISAADLQTWVGTELTSGAFGAPDPQGIYTIVYPKGTVITQPNPVNALLGDIQSCKAFGGYHQNVSASIGDAGTASFAYAVIPTCDPVLDAMSSTLTHEWAEAATDPLLGVLAGAFTLTGGPSAAFFSPDSDHDVWAVVGGGEVGDMCETTLPLGTVPTDIGHPVQRSWSNASAAASHDPCVPVATGAFFDSAPVLNDTVTFTSTITGDVSTKGVVIPVGTSKSIEVDMFSDGDTGGPWTVQAVDVLATLYGSYGIKPTLAFAWDRTQGTNGEKLHLAITVTNASPLFGGAHAFMIISTKGSRSTTWPGLVVEQ